VLTSESWTPKAGGAITTILGTWMEVRRSQDFVLCFLRGRKGNDVVWVIVDHLTKSILFLPTKMANLINKLVKLYVNEVVRYMVCHYQSYWIKTQIHFTLMDTCFGDEIKFKYSFSPLDWWAVRENNPGLRGFVKSLHIRIWSQLGGPLQLLNSPTITIIRLQ